MGRNNSNGNDSGLNFEAQLWDAAEQAVPAPNCKRTEYNGARPDGLCLGPIFLKYISDAFESNMSDWGGEHLPQDVRWKFGMPPVNDANYAWIQHFIHHLSPVGVAGFVMANITRSAQSGSMKTTEDCPQIRHRTRHRRRRDAERRNGTEVSRVHGKRCAALRKRVK